MMCSCSRRQRFFVIVLPNLDRRLQDDRSAVGALVDEVNRATAHLHAVRQHVAMSMRARERRQQRRMDIHDPILVRANERRAQDSHEAGKDHQIDFRRPQLVDHFRLERQLILKSFSINAEIFDPRARRSLERHDIGLIGQHDRYLSVELAVGDRVYYRLQVGAAPRAQYSEFQFGIHLNPSAQYKLHCADQIPARMSCRSRSAANNPAPPTAQSPSRNQSPK